MQTRALCITLTASRSPRAVGLAARNYVLCYLSDSSLEEGSTLATSPFSATDSRYTHLTVSYSYHLMIGGCTLLVFCLFMLSLSQAEQYYQVCRFFARLYARL